MSHHLITWKSPTPSRSFLILLFPFSHLSCILVFHSETSHCAPFTLSLRIFHLEMSGDLSFDFLVDRLLRKNKHIRVPLPFSFISPLSRTFPSETSENVPILPFASLLLFWFFSLAFPISSCLFRPPAVAYSQRIFLLFLARFGFGFHL